MLDGLLGRGFSSKCKSLIKLTKTRLDVIARKRSAVHKFLKKDIADLLANGLDINAFGRAEGLPFQLSLSSCYDSVEHFCECILKHLSDMQKQKECPEECRVAVSSLMFAAARFADLPELRDLRDIFTQRYGKALEPFVNKQFVDNLVSKPPTVEKKLQLMREIAQEFSIKWDSKAFQQTIANPLLPAQDPPKRRGAFNDPKIDENNLYNRWDEIAQKRDNQNVSSSGRRTLFEDGDILHGNREETTLDRDHLTVPLRHGSSDDGYKVRSEGDQTFPEKNNQDLMSYRGVELTDDRYKQHKVKDETIVKKAEFADIGLRQHKGRDHTIRNRENYVLPRQETNDGFKPRKGSDDTILKKGNLDNSYHGRSKSDNGRELHDRTENTFHRRDKPNISSYKGDEYPTTKQNVKMDSQEEARFAGDNHKAPYNFTENASKGAESVKPLPPPPYLKPNGGKYTTRHATSDCNKDLADVPANGRLEKIQMDSDRRDYNDKNPVGLGSINGDDKVDHPDDVGGDKKPKPKSARRRHLKPPSGQDYRGSNEGDEIVKRYPNGRREEMRHGLQHVLEDDRSLKDEEERAMDKLLLHYSKKPSKFEQIRVRAGLNSTPDRHDVADAGELQRHRKNSMAQPEAVPPPSRAVSLPPEPATSKETERVPARATSFQPEMMRPGAHVHPRLPDYDDLAARFAALKGR